MGRIGCLLAMPLTTTAPYPTQAGRRGPMESLSPAKRRPSHFLELSEKRARGGTVAEIIRPDMGNLGLCSGFLRINSDSPAKLAQPVDHDQRNQSNERASGNPLRVRGSGRTHRCFHAPGDGLALNGGFLNAREIEVGQQQSKQSVSSVRQIEAADRGPRFQCGQATGYRDKPAL